MPAGIIEGVSLFKAIYDSAKALKDINDASVRNSAVIELQEKILAARDAQSTLLERIGELEKEVAAFKTREAEKKRYVLERLEPGVFVYTLKPEMAAGEPAHRIYQKCFQQNKKSVLNSDAEYRGIHRLTCSECGTKLQIGRLTKAPLEEPYNPFEGPNSWMGR